MVDFGENGRIICMSETFEKSRAWGRFTCLWAGVNRVMNFLVS